MGTGPIAGDRGIHIGVGAGALIGGIVIGAGAGALTGGIVISAGTGAFIGGIMGVRASAAMGMGAGSGPMSELRSLRPKKGKWKPSADDMTPGSGPGAGASIGDIIIGAGAGALIGGIIIGAGAGASVGDIIQGAGAGTLIGGIVMSAGAGALMGTGMGAGSGPMSELCSLRPEKSTGRPSAGMTPGFGPA